MHVQIASIAPESPSRSRFPSALTASEWEERLERQRELESGAVDMGRAKYRERVAEAERGGQAAQAGAMLSLVRVVTQRVETVLTEWLAGSSGRRGPKHRAMAWVEKVGVPDAAYFASRSILNLMHVRPTVRYLCTAIADDIVSELQMRVFRDKAPGLFKYKFQSFQGSTSVHMARSLGASMRGAMCDECRKTGMVVAHGESCPHLDVARLGLTISDENSIHLGMKLLDSFITATGLVEEERGKAIKGFKRGKVSIRETNLIVPGRAPLAWLDGMTPLEWLEKRNGVLEEMFPPHLPMVVPPLRWEPGVRGGYRYSLRGRHAFVRGLPKAYKKEMEKANIPLVYEAVNRMQETAWKVNRRVLDVMQEIIDRGGERAGIVRTQAIEIPSKPAKEWASDEERKADPEWRDWRKAAGRAHDKEYRRGLKARELYRMIHAAERVADEQAIWFPYSVDFRGRVYPLTSEALSPQGDDKQKGLLLFSEGKPLGEDGAAWLAVHGANCLGEWEGVKLSKMTLQERADVIQGLTLRIEEAARDPWSDTFWMDADEPWQFLAFCFEWAGFTRMWREGRGGEYSCALPVAVDGTCNGLQVFSGLFLDEVGAASVNVSPAERPQDVYQRIADKVQGRVEEDADTDPLAYLWLASGLIGRKLAKRPTMTFGYGSKRFGFKSQLMQWLSEDDRAAKAKAHFQLPDEESGKMKDVRSPACAYMAGLIWDALQDVVVKAAEGMKWMQDAARVVAQAGQPIRWTVPGTGFPVVQAKRDYFVQEEKQVKTVLCGRLTYPAVYLTTDEVNARKQASAISPNVIHSLDACMLQLTVVECARMNGDMSFAMVHDSYGTHAADMTLLSQTLRETFIRLFTEQDVAAELYRGWLEQAPEGEEVPVPPSKGTLDISEVVHSDYFFC